MSSKGKAKGDTFDLFDIDPITACNKGVDIELVHPSTREPLGSFLVLTGKEGDNFKNVVREMSRENILKNAMRGTRGKPQSEAEKALEDALNHKGQIQTAVGCCVGWWRFEDTKERTGRVEAFTFMGEELEYSPGNARKVFEERPWIAIQADEAVADLGNFMPG